MSRVSCFGGILAYLLNLALFLELVLGLLGAHVEEGKTIEENLTR